MRLIPVIGAFVKHAKSEMHGVIQEIENPLEGKVRVKWQLPSLPSLIHVSELRSGLTPGFEVLDKPRQLLQPSLGLGKVMQIRTVGGSEQALVDFWEARQKLWLPWQNLKPERGVKTIFSRGDKPGQGSAEKLRLRNLAYALEQWHSNTGALSKLSIDPLPHQIHLVHRILSSGNLNWMIADDVGLGKTIEVGMLLSSLKQRGFKRILIVTPSGLTRQWQEEMRDKFELGNFQIYGRDIFINDERHWKMFDHVISSVDLLKSEEHLQKIRASGQWDLIIFDEAHRLSRSQYGRKFDSSDRFRLAANLRSQTENFLLLTATPHQGRTDKFQALLELLRPDPAWSNHIRQLQLEPDFLKNVIIRNRKADVTDSEGNFIFKGKITQRNQVTMTDEERAFDKALRNYLTKGYNKSGQSGNTSQSIGFVMTIYRKLAASSITAIGEALLRRAKKLEQSGEEAEQFTQEEEYFIEYEEKTDTPQEEFFEGELDMLQNLLDKARAVYQKDSKLQRFMEVIEDLLARNPDEKVLIFTEYRSTQDYLVKALTGLSLLRFGTAHKVDVIRGGQKLEEREEAMRHFEDAGQFLVSTEAGGEGLNLQRQCHIMVNYDLPWNPMRLVQRVGRLYRYGQQKPVLVMNMQVEGTIDSDIIDLMYTRLEQIASDMAHVNDEYKEGLKEDILGELVSQLDVDDLLNEVLNFNQKRSTERLEEALKRAREATELQDELLSHATGFDPEALADELKLTTEHLKAFVEGMCEHLNIEIYETLHQGKVWSLRLPEEVRKELNKNQNLRICFDKPLATRLKQVELVNAEGSFLQLLLRKAKEFSFGGHGASILNVDGKSSVSAILRWQNDRGVALNHEYVNLLIGDDRTISVNNDVWAGWLLQEAQDAPIAAHYPAREHLELAETALHERLKKRANSESYPDSWMFVSAAWVDRNEGLD
jgi:superfamily II DNA or RNA helicase